MAPLAALRFLLLRALYACPVCFGETDNPGLGRAYNLGIFILLGFTFLLLGGLAFVAYRIEVAREKAGLRTES